MPENPENDRGAKLFPSAVLKENYFLWMYTSAEYWLTEHKSPLHKI